MLMSLWIREAGHKLLVLPLFLPSTLEADLKWLVLPLFLTLIPKAAHKLLVLLMFETDLKQLVLLLVLSEATMMVVAVLNTILYLMSMSCPIIENWHLNKADTVFNKIKFLTMMS